MPRVSFSYGHQRRPRRLVSSSRQGSQAPLRVGLSALDTIKSSRDISQLFSSGFRVHTPYITFIVGSCGQKEETEKKQHDSCGRAAFVAGRKQGNAVWRNSAKRRMRVIYRDLGLACGGFDIVLLAKKPILKVPYGEVLESCRASFARSDFLYSKDGANQ